MARCTLTRRVKFAAAHRYRRPEWDDEKNYSTFGPCAWPNFHGHSYVCEVTVEGEIDPVTGFVVDLVELDAILKREVTDRFEHRNINMDIPEFGEGKLIPTGENIAKFIFDRVKAGLEASGTTGAVSRITSVKMSEDDTFFVTYSED